MGGLATATVAASGGDLDVYFETFLPNSTIFRTISDFCFDFVISDFRSDFCDQLVVSLLFASIPRISPFFRSHFHFFQHSSWPWLSLAAKKYWKQIFYWMTIMNMKIAVPFRIPAPIVVVILFSLLFGCDSSDDGEWNHQGVCVVVHRCCHSGTSSTGIFYSLRLPVHHLLPPLARLPEKYVTCGSAIKLTHVESGGKFLLHSDERQLQSGK